ncbi:MAG: hypothetical protein K0R58_1925 [Ramlibacter sp.]|jgi:hypothetical protein|nr:hypothetical protein [Ramlibacter sp.]
MQFKKIITAALAGLLVACGGDGGMGTSDGHELRWTSRAAEAVVAGQTQIVVNSDAGDFVGQGRTYTYTQADAIIKVQADGGELAVRIEGDESWAANFALPNSQGTFSPGSFLNLTRYPFHDPAVGGLQWSGDGRSCNTVTGSFRVNTAEYVGSELIAIDLDFVQHCEGETPALYGNIRWLASDTTRPPGPIRPVPDALWAPDAAAMPAAGNFVYLESEAGEHLGGGTRFLYTPRNAALSVSSSSNLIGVAVNGDEVWAGRFKAMQGLPRMRPGWYGDLERYPFQNPADAGMDWSGNGRSCSWIHGWFAIDEITYVDGRMTTLDMRFEQDCNDAGRLRGRIRWSVDDDTVAPGPLRNPPPRLWRPPAAATPASGNYVFLHSLPGDVVGEGVDRLVTSGISAAVIGRELHVSTGTGSGVFSAMDSIRRIRPGYYGVLQRYPIHNPAKGGISWGASVRQCDVLDGWVVIDDIRYDVLGLLKAVDMRFFQRCAGSTAPLRGAVHWVRSW